MSHVKKIKLYVRNEKAYIWTSDEWALMRRNRIVGNLVGNLATLPRQDFHESLPLALLPEEATLLVEKNLAEFVEVPSLVEMPSDKIREQSQEFRKNILSEQVGLLKESRKREIEKHIKQIVKGKKAKKKFPIDSNSASLTDEEFEKQILNEECSKITEPKPSSLSVQIFMRDPWIEVQECNKKCDWRYPETEEEKLRYYTFKNLWEENYYITSGRKFGADYLVYPGDPVKFHSYFIVVCMPRKRDLRPADIIMYGRLGQAVRKTFVISYVTEEGNVSYQSIQWTGQ